MIEDQNTKESTGVLANALFSKGFLKIHDYHMKAFQMAIDNGSRELADKHSKFAQIALAHSILMDPAPNLTEEENKKYLELLNRRYKINENGDINENEIDNKDNKELLELINKGYPEDEKPEF